MVSCPICGKTYDVTVIENHADSCGEMNKHKSELPIHTLIGDLEDIKEKIYPADGSADIITVLRKRFLNTAMENLVDLDFSKKLNVMFIGEDGVDGGGLTREFFSLLFTSTPIFENEAFSSNSDHLNEKTYKLIGQACAYSILIGNQGPQCIAPYIVDFMLNGRVPKVEDIPAQNIPGNISQAINDINQSDADLTYIVTQYADAMESAGFKKVLNETNKKEATVALTLHFGFYRFLPQILQFMEGLKLHGVLDVLIRHSFQSSPFFTPGKVHASEIITLFKPSYSDIEGQKDLEEVIVYNFHTFLKKLERGKIETQWLDPEEPYVDTPRVVSMEDFLQATTGSRAIVKNAATGLLIFDHSSNRCSSVNTCAPSITITQTELNQDYSFFENSMINITVAYGFGIQ